MNTHAFAITMPRSLDARRSILTLIAICSLVSIVPRLLIAGNIASLNTLYSFEINTGDDPFGPIVQGVDGNLYGTTASGGTNNHGTVFRVTPSGMLTVLYNFSGNDGADPETALVQARNGDFYGTTARGGTDDAGTIFKLTPAGALTVIYSFSGNSESNFNPSALVQGADGNFYGTTVFGGAATYGTAFRFTPRGVLTTLYSFAGENDGGEPIGGLAQGSDGSFYGTTFFGGINGGGTVFKITPQGVLTTLHNFNGTDGLSPESGLVQGTDGSFYGTTYFGGADFGPGNGGAPSNGYGTIFKITPQGLLSTLYSFYGGTDGANPQTGVVQGADGNLYGTNGATIYQVTPAGVFTTLYSFPENPYVLTPFEELVQNTDGSIYVASLSGAFTVTIYGVTISPSFFSGQAALPNEVYYLAFVTGSYFGYYSFLSNPGYIYHYDLGYEYVLDANDGNNGVYLYDFASDTFFYTSPEFPFPFLYDFTLNSVLYYYPDTANPGHYYSNPRYFFDYATNQTITK